MKRMILIIALIIMAVLSQVCLAKTLYGAPDGSLKTQEELNQQRNEEIHYTIKHGDSFRRIAKKFGFEGKDWKIIARANGYCQGEEEYCSPLIHPGDVLVILVNNQTAQEEQRSQLVADEIIHKVKQGESVYRISKIYGVSMEAIAKRNQREVRDLLKVGTELIIPEQEIHEEIDLQIQPADLSSFILWSSSAVKDSQVVHCQFNVDGNKSISKAALCAALGIYQSDLEALNPNITRDHYVSGDRIVLPVETYIKWQISYTQFIQQQAREFARAKIVEINNVIVSSEFSKTAEMRRIKKAQAKRFDWTFLLHPQTQITLVILLLALAWLLHRSLSYIPEAQRPIEMTNRDLPSGNDFDERFEIIPDCFCPVRY